ncbi:MAG: hypothetical protein ACOYBS_00700 [Flavobacterium sp.]
MQTIKFSFIFLFFVTFAQGQIASISKIINGKVTASYNDLEGIYLINLKTEKSTLTEHGGYFSINASVGDTLLFSSVQFKGLKVALKESDFTNNLFFVKMEPIVRFLDEVKINEFKNINAVSLGIISPFTKHYTPAQRKLYTATTGGGIVPIDPILNWLSGRTAMLKKEVEVEKKETLLDKVDGWFETKYFTQTLRIPEEYVKGFEYYIVEDAKFAEAVKSKNKTMATFIMNELAVQYKGLLLEK